MNKLPSNFRGLRTTGHNLSEVKRIGEWLWPRSDERCAAFTWKRLPDLDQALRNVERFGVCVQAGGNTGVWPAVLADRFDAVYTFEADPLNFRCLAANVQQENVFKFNAALGNKRGCVDMERTLNCGAHQISGFGRIPTLRIDDLELPACDFLQLDIEGYEYFALQGGEVTIMKYKPVIMVEVKGKAKRYGIDGENAKALLESWGAKLLFNVNADWVYAWPSK